MSENPNLLDYLWTIFITPFVYVIPKYISISNKVTKNSTDISNLQKTDQTICANLTEINRKLDGIARDLNQTMGRFEEHKDKFS